MKTFETSLGNSLSTNNMNFEKMSSVAEKSFCVVDELKTDFDNRFDKLRKELKENEELRSIILKNEQNMAKMDMDIQLQKKQIEDFKRREDDALRREEKYKQREDQLLIRIKEAERHHSFRDTPPPSQHQDLPVLQRNERSLLETGMQISKPGFSGKDMVPSKRDSEHLGYLCSRNTNENIQATNIAFPPSQSVLQKCYPGSSLAEDTGSTCHCFPSQANAVQFPLTQKVNETHVLSETNAIIYPLPTTTSMHIAPVQKSDSSTQCLPLVNSYSEEWQKQLSISFPITAVSPTIRPSIQLEKQVEQPTKTAPSPANRLLLLTKDKWPKHSPVATVLSQVQVRQQVPSHDRSSNQDKKQQEDPLGIFIFDLTASPILDHSETECHLDQETLMVKREQIDESPVKTKSSTPKKRQKKNAEKQLRKYGTRSRGKVEENENTSIEKGVSKIRSKKSCQTESSSSKTISGLKRKAHNTGVVTNNKKKCDIGIAASAKSHAKEFDLKTHDTQVLEEISRSSFKRQRSEKRTLNLAGSSLFEIAMNSKAAWKKK
ncbi:uncharacterized protein LOC116298488 [Actinia tenebrosa]|uniref:Uncharacterized protein LOC116298488 n=1 Tax=Actinia tenebrosa TaxID=6105 RepID=A0A6P8I2S2_ACTTE|nr:uncharacterized protein LOC116298488 [Actinia tenebrosa]